MTGTIESRLQIIRDGEYETALAFPVTIAQLKAYNFDDSSFGIDEGEREELQNDGDILRIIISHEIKGWNSDEPFGLETSQRLEVFEARSKNNGGHGWGEPDWFSFDHTFNPFWVIEELLTATEKQQITENLEMWEKLKAELAEQIEEEPDDDE